MTRFERFRAARPMLLIVELALITATFIWEDHIPLSKTPVLFAIAWISMWLRGVTWRSVGFTLPAGWMRLAVIGLIAGIAMWGLEFFVEQPLLRQITGELPDLHVFDDLVGNLKYLLVILGLNIVLAAFGEEMVWRGYALPRVAGLIGDDRNSWVAALVLVNIAFGLAHLYQGLPGVIEAGFAGFLLGLLYLGTGRNLIAPMVAHWISNNIEFVLIYFGLHPAVGS
jgi:membrane protease YdiL (CAAX protease family)